MNPAVQKAPVKSSSQGSTSSSNVQRRESESARDPKAGLRGLSYDQQVQQLAPPAAAPVQMKASTSAPVQREEVEGYEDEANQQSVMGPPPMSSEDEPGVCMPDETPAPEAQGASAPAAGKDKAEGTKAYGVKNGMTSLGLGFKAGTDGISAQIDGKISKSWQIPTSVPGLFAEITLSATGTGKASKKSDGSFEGGASVQGDASATLNYGVPKVASVYGGGKGTVKIDGVKVKIDPQGKMKVDLAQISLKVALLVGAKLDVSFGEEFLPKGWALTMQNKIEWNPGGEFELLRAGYIGGEWTYQKGADVERLEQAIRDLTTWGSSLPGESWAERDNKGREHAWEPQRLPPGKI
jgi:hypothetical protein